MGLTTVIKDYGTEILNAIRDNNLAALKLLLEKQLRSDSKIAKLCVTDIKHKPSKKFACPIILAARLEDPSIMEYMMLRGTDPNFVHHTVFTSRKRETITALHIAVDLCNYDVIDVLLNANADCNIPDHNQETALHLAVKKADRIMVRMLLSRGANPAATDKHKNAPLHIATLYGHLQIVRTLLKYDADIFQKGEWDAVPPHIAAREGHIHLIQLFCKRYIGNANVKIPCFPDAREKALLHLAAEHAHVETVVALLDQFEADVALKDSDGNTPLHCVVLSPYDTRRMQDKDAFNETARMLIKFDSPINEKNEFGDTPLHLAAMHHFQRIVEMLLAMGANPFAENNEKLKPIDLVPDSDPVTKQILKTAMSQPKGAVNATLERLRRELDLTPMNAHHQSHTMSLSHGGRSSALNGSVMQHNGRTSTLNGSASGRERRKGDKRATISTNADSLSLASDNEDPNQSHLPLPKVPSQPQSSPEDQLRREAAQRKTIEKEKQRAKRAAEKQQQQLLLQQQQLELANGGAIYHNSRTKAVENEIATHESLEHVPRRREKKPPAPEPMALMDDDDTNTTVSTVMTQDTYGQQLNQEAISQMAAKLARKKLREQQRAHRNSANDSVYSEDVLNEQQQLDHRVVAESVSPESKKKKSSKKQREDIVYQNFDNLGLQQIKVGHQPARDSRQSVTSEATTATDDLETGVKRRHHRHRHRDDRRRSDGSEQSYIVRPVRDKPGTIEVQYRGGPITIAVDTQGNACTLEHLTGLQQIVQQFGNPTIVESGSGSTRGDKMAADDEGTLPERTSEFMDDEITVVTNDAIEQESAVSDDILGQGRRQVGVPAGAYNRHAANSRDEKSAVNGGALPSNGHVQQQQQQPVKPQITQPKPAVTAPKPQVSKQMPTMTSSSAGVGGGRGGGGGGGGVQPGGSRAMQRQGSKGSDSLEDVSSDDTGPPPPPVTEFSSFADKLAWAKQMSKGKLPIGTAASSDSSIDQSKVQVLPSPDSDKFQQQRAPHDFKIGGSVGALDRFPSTSSGDASPAQVAATRRRWSSTNKNSDDEGVQVARVLDVSRMERLHTEVFSAKDINRKPDTKVLQAVVQRAEVKIDKASIIVGQGMERASSFVENRQADVGAMDAQTAKESKYFSLESLRTADAAVARESAPSPGATSLGSGSGRSRGGLKLKVDGEVPKAHDKESIQPARAAFMQARPVSIVSSSDASDVEEGYRRSTRDVSRSPRDRVESNKSSSESAERLAETVAGEKPTALGDTAAKPLELAGYVKPYESFGKIQVQTDALDDEMAKFSSDEDLSMSRSEENEDGEEEEERPTTETTTTTGAELMGSFAAIGQSDTTHGSFGSSHSLDMTGPNRAREFDSANVSHAEVIDVLFNYSDTDFSESEHYHNLTNEISTHSNVPVVQAKVVPVKATEIRAQKPTELAKVVPANATEKETNLSVEDLTGSPGSKRRGSKAAPAQQKPAKVESIADRSFLADEEVALINEFSETKKDARGKQLQKPQQLQQQVRKKTPDADEMLEAPKKPKPPIAEKPKAAAAAGKLVATSTQTPVMAPSVSPAPKVHSRPNSASRMSPDVKITVVGDAKITAGGVIVATPSPHFDEKPDTSRHHRDKSSSKKNKSKASDSERDESFQEQPSSSSKRSKDKDRDAKKKKKKSSSKDRSEGSGMTTIDKLKRSEADRGSASSVDTLDVVIPHAQIVKGEPAKKLPVAVIKVKDEDRDESSQGSVDLDVSIPTVFREEPVGDVFAAKKKQQQAQKQQQKLLAAAAAEAAQKHKTPQETDLDRRHRGDDSEEAAAERRRRREEKKSGGKRSKSKEKTSSTPTKSSAKSKEWQAREEQQEEMERVLRTLTGKIPDPATQRRSSKHKHRREREDDSDNDDVELSYSDEDDDDYESRHPVYISSDVHAAQQKHSRLEVHEPQPRSTGANDKIFRPTPVYRPGSKPLLFSKPPKGREADNQSPIVMRKSASKYRGDDYGALTDSEMSSSRGLPRHYESGMHSDSEVFDMEPLPQHHEAALKQMVRRLSEIEDAELTQPSILQRNPSPALANYVRNTYRAHPVKSRGPNRSANNSSRSSAGRDSRRQESSYDDSELLSQLWLEDRRRRDTESEGGASADESGMPGVADQSAGAASAVFAPNQQPIMNSSMYPPGVVFTQCVHPGLIGPHGPCPACVPRHFFMPPLRLPYPSAAYGSAAQLWHERMQQGAVHKSKAMYMSVMPDNFQPPADMVHSGEPADQAGKGGDDDMHPQWIMARGRDTADESTSTQQDESLNADDSAAAEYRQMLLFFQIGGNWTELAWILFQGVLNEAEMVRMVEDIRLKHPGQLQEQVQDMMHRWWKRKGAAATIEELQRALKITGMAYIKDELNEGRNSRLENAVQSDNELDVGAISDADPEVNRLANEFAGAHDLADSDATASDDEEQNDDDDDPSQRGGGRGSDRRFVNTDKVMSRLRSKGLVGGGNSTLGASSSKASTTLPSTLGGRNTLNSSRDSLNSIDTVPLTGGQIPVRPEPAKFVEYQHETTL